MKQWRRAVASGEQLGARPELARTWAEVARALDTASGLTFGGLDAAACRERARGLFAATGLAWDLAQTPAVRAA
jgi:hypothetical protein